MRRFALAGVVLAAAVIALPAAARGFRVDAASCDSAADTDFTCWGGVVNPAFLPILPIGVVGQTPVINSSILSGLSFSTSNFFLQVLDLDLFLLAQNINAPFPLPSTFLSEFHTTGYLNGAPAFKVEWNFFDPSKIGGVDNVKDVLEPFYRPGDDELLPPQNLGLQLIFQSDGTFQLNGLQSTAQGYEFSFSKDANGDFLWRGAEKPCDTFTNAGTQAACSLSVPEPSSVALLGLGFLALVVGLRTGRPARLHLA